MTGFVPAVDFDFTVYVNGQLFDCTRYSKRAAEIARELTSRAGVGMGVVGSGVVAPTVEIRWPARVFGAELDLPR